MRVGEETWRPSKRLSTMTTHLMSRLVSNFGVDINRTDAFDASPLMLVSPFFSIGSDFRRVCVAMQKLCNIYSILERYSIATPFKEKGTTSQYIVDRRCLYGALNNAIRLMLLKFDISKAVDPTQPFAAFLISLLNPVDMPATTDIIFQLESTNSSKGAAFSLHRFILAARNEDFRKNLESRWIGKHSVKMASCVHPRSIESIVKYLYSGEAMDPGREYRDNLKFVAETLHLPPELMELVSATGRPPTPAIRDLKRMEMNRVQSDFEKFVHQEIITRQRTVKMEELEKAREEMSTANPVWADCLLYLDREDGTTTLFYVHIAILMRSEYFFTMFTSPFAESRMLLEHQETLPLLQLDVDPDAAPIILTFLYTDRAEIPRDIALEVLCASAFLLLPRLKSLAAIALENESDPLNDFMPEDLYEILRAAWLTNTERLEYSSTQKPTHDRQFAAKNLAKHLDTIVTDPEFHLLVKESASRISNRQETDTIELIDDVHPSK
jgi:ankyrin repeat and BTB/POZ domain-containing protein 1